MFFNKLFNKNKPASDEVTSEVPASDALVSIVIPAYNHENFIGPAIQSVLEQSHSNIELIIVNDGSTDSTDSVIRGYSDNRIQYISQENQGAHNALNNGIALAKGKYLTILNSDDVFHTSRIAILVNELETSPDIAMIGTAISMIDAKGAPIEADNPVWKWYLEAYENHKATDDIILALLRQNFLFTTSNLLFRAEVISDCGGFLPLRYAHDLEFMVKVACRHKIKVIDDRLMMYRIHGSNTISENQYRVRLEVAWIYALYIYKYYVCSAADSVTVDSLEQYHRMSCSAKIIPYSLTLLQYRLMLQRQVDPEKAEDMFINIIENPDNSIHKRVLSVMKEENENSIC